MHTRLEKPEYDGIAPEPMPVYTGRRARCNDFLPVVFGLVRAAEYSLTRIKDATLKGQGPLFHAIVVMVHLYR